MANSSFLQYRSDEYEEFKYWIFRKGQSLALYREETPNAEEVSFTFWKINNSTWDLIEEQCIETIKLNEHEETTAYNFEKMKMFYLRYMFRSWNLSESMFFDEEGKLDSESFQKLLSIHPVILRELVDGLSKYTLSQDELTTISKQCHVLFANNQSVANPHKMISLYCLLTEMWSKFGLNYFDLKRLPLYEKNALRKIVSIENQIRSAEIKKMENKNNSSGRRSLR